MRASSARDAATARVAGGFAARSVHVSPSRGDLDDAGLHLERDAIAAAQRAHDMRGAERRVPANGISKPGVKIRTCAVALLGDGSTNVVSDRFIWRASACICSSAGRARPRTRTVDFPTAGRHRR